MAPPLARLRVLEYATWVAGPYAGKLLADNGADVIKIEPPGGDPLRRRLPADLTPRPPSLRGKGVPSTVSPSNAGVREHEGGDPDLSEAPPSLGGKGAGGLGPPPSLFLYLNANKRAGT